MINNRKLHRLAVWAVLAGGCDQTDPTADPAIFQGVVELEARDLPFEVTGRVQMIAVQEGERVVAGTTLARIDDTLAQLDKDTRVAEARAVRARLELLLAGSRPEDIKARRADLSAARSREDLAERNAARLRPLERQGIVTASDLDLAEADVDQATARRREAQQQLARLVHGAREQEVIEAEARVQAAEAAVRAAEERIARHVLVADRPGEVLDVLLEPHELATAGAPVLTVADVEHPYVDVFVPQDRLAGLAPGTPAILTTDALPGGLGGTVEYVAQRTEFTPNWLFSPRERPNLMVRIRVRVQDPKAQLHAGVPAFVRFSETSG
jgi:HlyD family secretion protein